MQYTYKTKGTCCSQIQFDIEKDIVHSIKFLGGCPGNTLAVSKLLEGKSVQYIYETLKGNFCGGRGTSCADQLAIAVAEAYEKENQ